MEIFLLEAETGGLLLMMTTTVFQGGRMKIKKSFLSLDRVIIMVNGMD